MIAAMERAFAFMSAGFVVAAAFLLSRGRYYGAFVTAALGLLSWFLRIRVQLRRSVVAAQEDGEEEKEGGNDKDEIQGFVNGERVRGDGIRCECEGR